jgi:hypothetical protein
LGLWIAAGLLLAGCRAANPLVGRWRTAPPSSLLYEYRADGSVLLHQDGATYRVFRYKLLDADRLELFDGMGRMRVYDFQVTEDTLVFFEAGKSEAEVEALQKEPKRWQTCFDRP